jgi:hypothetical protein
MGSEFRDYGFRVQGIGFRIQELGLKAKGV